MWEKIKASFEFAATRGWNLPAAFDSEKQGPSTSLFFSHLANILALLSIIFLLIKDTFNGTIMAIIYSSLMLVFYLMRRISKFKVDLDDRSIDLQSSEEKETKQ